MYVPYLDRPSRTDEADAHRLFPTRLRHKHAAFGDGCALCDACKSGSHSDLCSVQSVQRWRQLYVAALRGRSRCSST